MTARPQPIANAPSHMQVVFVGNLSRVAAAFRKGEGPWQTVDADGNPGPLDFEPTHWAWRRADFEAERERGGDCELCGRPVRPGQVVLPYDDIGEVHADCHDPYSLKAQRPWHDGEEGPEPVLLLGRPMRHFPLPDLTPPA